MFTSIVSKVTDIVRKLVRGAGAALRTSPWLAPVAIFALLLVV